MRKIILRNLVGPIIFLIGATLVFYIIPKEKIKKLLPFGLIAGLGIALLLLYLMQEVWGRWLFYRVDLLYFYEIPFFLSLAWLPMVMLFAYFLKTSSHNLFSFIVILAFPLGATLVHWGLLHNRMLVYHRWDLLGTFGVSLLIHSVLYVYLYFSRKQLSIN